MGRATGHQASVSERRRRGSPSQEISYRRPSGPNEDGAATKRNVIPWRKMEEELAKRLAAKAAARVAGLQSPATPAHEIVPTSEAREVDEDHGPASGVRSSQVSLEDQAVRFAGSDEPALDDPARPLTYSMYTVADLDTREVQAVRLTPTPPPAPQVVRWSDVQRSGLVVVRAAQSWLQAPKPRPRVLDVCRVPLVALGADLRAVLARLPWRKIGLSSAIALGSIFVLLFAVVLVAELTDDLRPSRSSALTAKSLAAPPATGPTGGAAIAAPAAVPVVDVDPSRNDEVVELDDIAPAPAKAKPSARPAAKPRPKRPSGPERFIP